MARKTGKSASGAFQPQDLQPAGQQLVEAAPEVLSQEQRRALEKLKEWEAMAQGAYPPNTVRAWRADWRSFNQFCLANGLSPLPATPHTVRAYVQHCMAEMKKPATIRRYLATIARVHLAADLLSPCASEPVRLALKEMSQEQPARQRQARPLGWAEIKLFLETAGKGIRADRERALLCVAYDTMARRSELIALDLEDLKFAADGTGTALIRRSKTDQAGEGAQAYLARETVRYLKVWMKAAKVTEGAVFRRLVGRSQAGPRLSVDMVADIVKRVGRWIELPDEEVALLSGHSIRVGATQDLLALNIDLASVMQAGRWKSTHMPMRYGEHVLAARGGMARAASEQGRDSPRTHSI
jgi:site-specific recombinase XerD